jgi:divalent metal cation (Fe/Co/Zn/Cd) transporter
VSQAECQRLQLTSPGMWDNTCKGSMSGLVQIGSQPAKPTSACAPVPRSHAVLWLQTVTLVWMLIECGVSLYAAATAHSPSLLAFGSDSLVELLSAAVVLLRYGSPKSISEQTTASIAGALLFVLAFVVASTALLALVLRWRPETSYLGMVVTVAALAIMPILATLKRREARRSNNVALAADAVQSATCAYLAMITLAGLAANAMFHIPWVDSVAALFAIPILLKEGRSAWEGHTCSCC